MSDHSVQITDSTTSKSATLPVVSGQLGPAAIDIGKLHKETGLFTYDPGFMSTASCRSAITYIDGDAGVLMYRGYPIEQLAKHSNFLEVAYLLMHGELPNAQQFSTFEPDPAFPTSCVARPGLAAFTKLFANKYAPQAIRMHNGLPGFINNLP